MATPSPHAEPSLIARVDGDGDGDGDLAPLPKDLEALRVWDGTKLTVDGLRELSRLTRLRSLRMGVVDPACIDALATVVQVAPPERFMCIGAPTQALWQALASRDGLRVLEVSVKRESLTEDLARLAGMKRLEQLTISCVDAPEPEALQQLSGLEKLRLVRLCVNEELITPGGQDTERAAALRNSLGPRVDVPLR